MVTIPASTLHLETDMDHVSEVFHLLSSLFLYPDEEWRDELWMREVAQTLEPPIQLYIQEFLQYVETTDMNDLTENYVNTFDFNAKTALYLTHDDSNEDNERTRGQALLRLHQLYRSLDLQVTAEELPDYLPLFLEFASLAPYEVLQEILPVYREAIVKRFEALALIDSPYASLMQACLHMIDEVTEQGGANDE